MIDWDFSFNYSALFEISVKFTVKKTDFLIHLAQFFANSI
ncbi:unknown [[Mannheimia] succiniciproducens MBEL55E]|uniref:Uncharacterized protein n=1 Tax=Mannheimia succiniciproducens (strain KCTC 0769BP / MBEL55E) TaxID=221988 RepID=Q65V14_MANSM|nr:unknown [[Mannheimia] succiniciproducens MBEL55E]